VIRLTSEMFVAAHIRRCESEGLAAVLVRHGAPEAGAIYVIVDRLDGTLDLYGPAPQTAFDQDDNRPGRLFSLMDAGVSQQQIDGRLEREARFDPDFWVIAIEDRDGRSLLDLAA